MKVTNIKISFFYQIIYRILTIITPLITSPYLSRILGAEKLGVFSATYAHVNYFILLAVLGIEYYGSRTIAVHVEDNKELQKKFWEIYPIQFGASVVSICLYYFTILFVDESRKVAAILQGLWLLSSMLDINWFFFGCQQFKLTVSRNIFVKIITILSIFLFVRSESDLYRYILVMTIGNILSQLITWFFLFKFIQFEIPRWKDVKIHIYPCVKLFLPMIALSIFHIMDKTMVDLLSDEINGGCYYNVDRLINIPLGIITAIGTVMLPNVTRMLHMQTVKEAITALKKSMELILFFASAIAFGLGAIANEFVPVFFGKGYELCVELIIMFIPVVIIKAIGTFIRQQYLIPSEKDNVYIRAVWLGAIINFVANYILISKYGAVGAVIGTLFAETIVLVVEIIGTYKEINFLEMLCGNNIYILIGLFMFVTVRFIAELISLNNLSEVIILIGFGASVYMVCSLIYWIKNVQSVFHMYTILIMNIFRVKK